MEGAMFYWSFWFFWVYATFILKKQNPYRLKIAAIVLIVIIFSNTQTVIGNFELNLGGGLLLLFSYLLLAKEKNRALIYLYICSLITAVAYVTFQLFEVFDPVWILFKREWMLGITIGYLALLLQNSLKNRLLMVAAGTMQGEMLYAYILNKFDFDYLIGSYAYLDVCSAIALILVGWSMLESAGLSLQHVVQLSGKVKHKSS